MFPLIPVFSSRQGKKGHAIIRWWLFLTYPHLSVMGRTYMGYAKEIFMELSKRQKGVTLAIGGSLFWGCSGVAAQYLFEHAMTTEWLVVVRMLTAGILLLLIDHYTSGTSIWRIWQDGASRWRLLLFGLIGMLAVQYTYFKAIAYSNAPTGTILQYLMPIIVIGWTSLTEHRLPQKAELLCALLAMVGTLLLVTHGQLDTLAISTLAVIWGILSAFAAAFYTTQPRWLLMRWPSTQVIGWAMLIGGLVMSLVFPPLSYPGEATLLSYTSLIFLCIFGTALAFWAYVTSTKYIHPKESGILNATEPLASIIFAVVLLDVSFGLAETIGALLIILPVVYISTRK